MKKIITLAVLLFTGILLKGPAQAETTPKVGDPAPAFSISDSQGKTQKLAGYQGKYVVLEWFNDGCPYVKKHYGSGNMQSLQKKYTDQGVV